MSTARLLLAVLCAFSVCPGASAQENGDVEALQQKVTELTATIEQLQLENELLNNKLDALTKQPTNKTEKQARLTLSDRLTVGLTLEGDYRSSHSAGIGRFMLTIDQCEKARLIGTGKLSFNGTDLGEGRWEGVIRNNRLSLSRVGSGKRVVIVFQLRGNELEGEFVDAQGNRGTVGLRLPLPQQ